jgi:hypothetical protein
MRKKTFSILAFSLTIVVLASLVSTLNFADAKVSEPKAKIIFKDDFKKTNLRDWTTVFGTWTVENGKLTQTDARLIGWDWSVRPTVVADVSVSDRFRIETRFTMISGGDVGSSAILFRYQDISNSLFVILNQWGAPNIIIGYAIDGAETNVWYPFAFSYNTEYKVKVEVIGNAIDVYVDGVLAASNPDLGAAYSTGKVGFHTTGTAVTYDDVVVSALR